MLFNNKFLDFENIKEINFKKVSENTYSITIKSDIKMNGKEIKDTIFIADYCQLDSSISLNLGRYFTNVELPNGNIVNSEYYDIPLNIKLLLNKELKEFFSITKN